MSVPIFKRQTVFLAKVPSDWKPQRFWSTPPAILAEAVVRLDQPAAFKQHTPQQTEA